MVVIWCRTVLSICTYLVFDHSAVYESFQPFSLAAYSRDSNKQKKKRKIKYRNHSSVSQFNAFVRKCQALDEVVVTVESREWNIDLLGSIAEVQFA